MTDKATHLSSPGAALPVDAMTAVQLLDLFLLDPDHDIDRIVDFISRDPVLTAETLRRCNNTVFSGAQRTTDIFEAVSRLGYYELYGVVAASLGRQATAPEPRAEANSGLFHGDRDDFGELW